MAGIKDVRVKVRLNILSIFLRDKGDVDHRPGKEGTQRKTIINIPEMEIPTAEFDTRVEYAVLVLQHGMSVSGANAPLPITDEASSVTHNSAMMNGHVDPYSALVATTVNFQYGLTKGLGSTLAATQSPLNTAANTAVSRALAGLTPETQYYYRVQAIDANYPAGKFGIIRTFVTDPAPA